MTSPSLFLLLTHSSMVRSNILRIEIVLTMARLFWEKTVYLGLYVNDDMIQLMWKGIIHFDGTINRFDIDRWSENPGLTWNNAWKLNIKGRRVFLFLRPKSKGSADLMKGEWYMHGYRVLKKLVVAKSAMLVIFLKDTEHIIPWHKKCY